MRVQSGDTGKGDSTVSCVVNGPSLSGVCMRIGSKELNVFLGFELVFNWTETGPPAHGLSPRRLLDVVRHLY